MDLKLQAPLSDILSAIERIESFFEDVPMRFDVYCADTKLRFAIERNIEIIGEAMNRILKMDPGIPITNAIAIVGTRNRIIHAYDAISDDIIWAIIVNHLPTLKREVSSLLNNEY